MILHTPKSRFIALPCWVLRLALIGLCSVAISDGYPKKRLSLLEFDDKL
jgi:hypothetical protein